MTKQEYMAASLQSKLKLMQLRKHYSTPQEGRVVTLDGIADICGLLPSDIYNNEIINYYTVFYRVDESTSGSDSDTQFIPIVRPLSDLTKEIEYQGDKFVPIDELNNIIDDVGIGFNDHYIDYENPDNTGQIDWLNEPFIVVMWLIEHHFDIYGLIDKGEAIDVNTLDINPYA